MFKYLNHLKNRNNASMTAMVEARVQLLISMFFLYGFLGVGEMVLSIDEKLLFREKNGYTPNYFFQDIGGTP